MRFIVELYRWLILGMLALALIGASYLVFKIIQAPELPTGSGAVAIAISVFAAVVVILSIGIMATFISIHDRLEDIADSAREVLHAREDRSVAHPEDTHGA